MTGDTAVLDRPRARPVEEPQERPWTPDLVLLAALLALTMLFGRSFSKFAVGDQVLYVTEWFLVAIVVATVWRHGLRGSWARLRSALPLVPLAVLWLAGAVATLRGLADYGFSMITHDVGLVEYSLLLPVVALTIDTQGRADALMKVLLYGSVASTLFYSVARFFPDHLDFAPSPDPAACVYVSIVLAYVVVRAMYGFRVQWWLWAVSAIGLIIQAAYGGRTGILAVGAALGMLVLLAPQRWRLRVAAAGAVAFGLAIVVSAPITDGIQSIDVRIPAKAQQERDRDVEGGGGGGGGRGEGGDGGSAPALRALRNSFNPNASGGDNANASWRVDFWRYMVEGAARQPLTGVGFGRPAAFLWNGAEYDYRRDDPNNPFDYTGPHNSFVNILYRTGFVGLFAVLALMALAARRVWTWWRADEQRRAQRATMAQVIVVFVFVSAVASFNVALEAPQMGLFFWLPLGLLFVLPKVWSQSPPR